MKLGKIPAFAKDISRNLMLQATRRSQVDFRQFAQDDVFLAEYPKSGVTWLSTILACLELDDLDADAPSFAALLSYVSEEGLKSALSCHRSVHFRGRLIKTHSNWMPWHLRAVYLYRDPARAIASLYNMSIAYGWISHSIDPRDFARGPQGIDSWLANVRTWLYESSAASTICFVSYDEMLNDPVAVVSRICGFFDADISLAAIVSAVNRCSRECMGLAEGKLINSDIRFTRRFAKDYRFVGASDDRNVDICEKIAEIVHKSARVEMKDLGIA